MRNGQKESMHISISKQILCHAMMSGRRIPDSIHNDRFLSTLASLYRKSDLTLRLDTQLSRKWILMYPLPGISRLPDHASRNASGKKLPALAIKKGYSQNISSCLMTWHSGCIKICRHMSPVDHYSTEGCCSVLLSKERTRPHILYTEVMV